MSQWLAEIEAAVDVRLFERGRQLKPTPHLAPVLRHARRVVAAFAAQPEAGTLGIDGKMYDMPHLIAAKRALASAGEDVT